MYQQTPQALSIDEYLPQVVYEPYKARHPLPAEVTEQMAARQAAQTADEVSEGSEEEESHAD